MELQQMSAASAFTQHHHPSPIPHHSSDIRTYRYPARRRSLSPQPERTPPKRARLLLRKRSVSMSPHRTHSLSLVDREAGEGDWNMPEERVGTLERLRRSTVVSQSDIHETITHPGTVRINVQGAFIVDDEEPATPQSEDYEHDPRDIRLPNHTAVVSHIAVDIGGSLAKLVYFSREPDSTLDGGRLNFLKFETEKIDACIDFMKGLQAKHERANGPSELCIMATGGGAFKFYDRIREALGVEVVQEDEMECLIIGLDFFITEIPGEVFTYSETSPMSFIPFPPQPPSIYPYLLVNIGSGVSMIKVTGPREHQRIGGTSLGGGTLWGLLSLLTGARNFDEMLSLADRGDNTAVDMLVGDIYGMDYGKIGLKSTTIASSFGKVYRLKRAAEREAEDNGGFSDDGDMAETPSAQDPPTNSPLLPSDAKSSSPTAHPAPTTHSTHFRPEDISRSLLYAVSNNIGQIAYLHAEKHKLQNIYFGGSFIGGHAQTMNTLSYAINFWSKGTKQAYFLRHEGYLGAVGAFLKRQPRNWGRRGSFDGRAEH
ncbi:fumble-domain-containing protein [Delitschia confertaspora ATCC 74209]|uniref:Fumble-domain-containing protein n=1 Tax=Delitschia confertaspora ATCC 74209 TaxID=1513339 RepID=A0A9P4JI75_9PLEO|nr:fumble-domain-containing protein [Delitschia confertaspora ATCC 74209]